ncbi:MAG TPA: DUF817 domain-containing protein [Chitinophagales bacterium]|nr:DUF817 domain-containing protein [Chitinophagales bacterium]
MFQKLEHSDHHAAFLNFLKEFFAFGIKQVLCCIFPAFIFFILLLSRKIELPFLYRYDFLLLMCIAMQAVMYFTKMETKDELLVITLFHLIGLAMEIFKVHMGSWSYPEEGWTKVFRVPLYSGFMYASVASYICQAWRWFELKITGWPGAIWAIGICITIYLNFFTHHFVYDLRYLIIPLLLIIFFKTKVYFHTNGHIRRMPLVVSFLLIGFFVWIAENIATFLGAWKYTYQHSGWQMVTTGKITSWFLMIVISIIIVIELKFIKQRREGVKENKGTVS